MALRDPTDMGGTAETFLTTHWSLIEGIQKQQDPKQALIGLLLERYWKPVYCYLRRTGCDNERAKDLTQGFFHEVVLSRHLIERADPSKGRFRGFLLHALKQYVIDTRRRQSGQTNIPAQKLVSLEIAHLPVLPQTVSQWGPDECFTYAWKSAILDQTLAAVEEDCLRAGQETHWQVFRDHLLRPTLEGREPPSLKELCRHYGLASEKTASNIVITVKRRFQRVLRQYLRSTVRSDAEADEELRDILETWHLGAQPGQ
jgi:DNA-directed RNA polymerase specialized sigma24 family protein